MPKFIKRQPKNVSLSDKESNNLKGVPLSDKEQPKKTIFQINRKKTDTMKPFRLVFKKTKPNTPLQVNKSDIISNSHITKLVPAPPINSSVDGYELLQRKLNKSLSEALNKNQAKKVRELLLQGASLAYCNYDGICTAAETGKLAVFKVIFQEFDFARLIDQELATDLLDGAGEHSKESGNNALEKFIEPFVSQCPKKIINENCTGFLDGELITA